MGVKNIYYCDICSKEVDSGEDLKRISYRGEYPDGVINLGMRSIQEDSCCEVCYDSICEFINGMKKDA